MRQFIIRRLLLIPLTLFLVSLIVFIAMRFVPGDVLDLMAAGEALTDLGRAQLEHELGLDLPIYEQYAQWMGNIIMHGDFGVSLWKQTSVTSNIFQVMPVTFELLLLAFIIGITISLPIGVYSAIRQDTGGDYIARSFAILCIAVPPFWLGTMVLVFPSIWWGWTPLSITIIPFTEDPIGNLAQFIVPALILGMALSGVNMRMTRTMMLEVLRQDYIRTAWAKGLRERVIVVRHALKNALIPVITILGLQVPYLVGGSVIVEEIFCLPGMGRLIINATNARDYPVVNGAVFFIAVGVLALNLLVDISYGFLDPRIRYR